MAKCEVCGNDYANAMKIEKAGQAFFFDSFECAINRLAPKCAHCGCTIVGHGMETGDAIYCCGHCARMSGETRLRDSA